ncbi:SCO3242 family prenyltransferase [Streptomyces sp. NBC_01497]|uniref:SCO3242 family prenyltransferase n=1 Tax=Streptomyces sp. NBC_01497 TaxID=2903885 RepID=UPI002E303C07|nr:UbiA family prenyltransferase [Streptomyces sp. NBC_01497]
MSLLRRARDWAELLRVSALFTVPGDALAGVAAAGARPGRGTALVIGSSLCLYEAGMALNDWADRAEDAVDRPHRPIPSGRIAPRAALAAAGALTAAGLALAAVAGRRPLAVSAAIAATVWAYDLRLKHTVAGPVAMGAARSLDVLLGASATPEARGPGAVLPAALALGAHTAAVTTVSRGETQGGALAAPLAALATATTLSAALIRPPHRPGAPPRPGVRVPTRSAAGPAGVRAAELIAPVCGGSGDLTQARTGSGRVDPAGRLVVAGLAAAYLATTGRPAWHALLNPSPPLTQRAVGGGIRAMIPLQSALAARAGDPLTALAVAALAPLARLLARKVSPT